MKKFIMLLLLLTLLLFGCNGEDTSELEKQIEELKQENQTLKEQLSNTDESTDSSFADNNSNNNLEGKEDKENEEEIETNNVLQFDHLYLLDGFAEFSLDDYEFTDKILPPDTSSAYGYYELSNENNIYLLMKGEIKNLHSNTIDLSRYADGFNGVAIYNENYMYDNVQFASPATNDSNPYKDSMDPLEETILYIYVEVPKEVSDNIQDLELQIDINNETFHIEFQE